MPAISVVVPTHDRLLSLRRLLDSLARQTVPADRFEVVVVADGCTDETPSYLAETTTPFALSRLTQAGAGPAAARNRGAALATSKLLLFLDDDLEPVPTLLEAHLRAHDDRENLAVVGPYLPPSGDPGYLSQELRAWWRRAFECAAPPTIPRSYHAVMSGNLSLARSAFESLGGFDEAFRVHEDLELGVRLLAAGFQIVFAPDARAVHHHDRRLRSALERARQDGRGDGQLARKWPALLPRLIFAKEWAANRRELRAQIAVALFAHRFVDRVAAAGRHYLDLLEALRLRSSWRHCYSLVWRFCYWSGVVEAFADREALAALLENLVNAQRVGRHALDVDLSQDLRRAAERIDRERPGVVRVRRGGQPLGVVRSEPGERRLLGEDLLAALAGPLAGPYLRSLVEGGSIPSSTVASRREIHDGISATLWFRPTPVSDQRGWWTIEPRWRDLATRAWSKREPTRSLLSETDWLEADRADRQSLAEGRSGE